VYKDHKLSIYNHVYTVVFFCILIDPEFKSNPVKVSSKSHNSFTVDCENSVKEWNGYLGQYEAKIKNKGTIEKHFKPKDNCWFEFENLYYLTEYTFEVFIYFCCSLNDIYNVLIWISHLLIHLLIQLNSDYSHKW